MSGAGGDVPDEFAVSVVVDAGVDAVWRALTDPAEMAAWMGEPTLRIAVSADWRVGGAVVITGFHHAPFRNIGVVQVCDEPRHLQYTHRSSMSRLPDVPESDTIQDFQLVPREQKTSLTATFRHFPTFSIYKHLAFYWRGTLPILARHVLSRAAAADGVSLS